MRRVALKLFWPALDLAALVFSLWAAWHAGWSWESMLVLALAFCYVNLIVMAAIRFSESKKGRSRQ